MLKLCSILRHLGPHPRLEARSHRSRPRRETAGGSVASSRPDCARRAGVPTGSSSRRRGDPAGASHPVLHALGAGRTRSRSGSGSLGRAVETWIPCAPVKLEGRTPTIVVSVSLTRSTVPMTFGSSPKRRSQKEWLIIATGLASGRSSAGDSTRPTRASTPSSPK